MATEKLPKKIKKGSVTKPKSVTSAKLTSRMKKAFTDKSKSEGATQKIYDTTNDKDSKIMKKGRKARRGEI